MELILQDNTNRFGKITRHSRSLLRMHFMLLYKAFKLILRFYKQIHFELFYDFKTEVE